jgi:hypothetical protein
MKLLLSILLLGCAGVCCGQSISVDCSKPVECHADFCKCLPGTAPRFLDCSRAGNDGSIVLFPCPSKPEPMDVPAINDRVDKICVQYSTLQWDGNQCDKYEDRKHWTCAEKTRVLLTDESGGKHCIKFPREQ